MKSSTGQYFITLDHVRALALFMVFAWHFTHGGHGSPVPYSYTPSLFPLALLDEGYTGVSLFMTLSGYLFAKLLDGKQIKYGAFLWNRAIRLLPLLIVVIIMKGIFLFLKGESIASYVVSIGTGIILPTLPNGGWSITTEFHYYLLLPIFLWMVRKSRFLPLALIGAAMAVRFAIFHWHGEVQTFAYWTIAGRIDQFALGMLVFQFRSFFSRRHLLAIATLSLFFVFYGWFDRQGGFYHHPSYPSTSPIWVFLLTLEGLAYAIAIAWYDSSFTPSSDGISGFIAKIGTYTYSLYLLHFFVVFDMARFVHRHIMDISNFYWAVAWSAVCFILIMPLGYLSFRFIESPFFKLRTSYVVK